jgi:hypothetical protein
MQTRHKTYAPCAPRAVVAAPALAAASSLPQGSPLRLRLRSGPAGAPRARESAAYEQHALLAANAGLFSRSGDDAGDDAGDDSEESEDDMEEDVPSDSDKGQDSDSSDSSDGSDAARQAHHLPPQPDNDVDNFEDMLLLQSRKRRLVAYLATQRAKIAVVGREANAIRLRMTWEEHMNLMADGLFLRAYRMSKQSFKRLADLVRPYVVVDQAMARRSTRTGEITTEMRLSIALRYFAGGSYLDIATSHGVHTTTFFSIVWSIVFAINTVEELAPSFPYDDPTKLEAMSARFQRRFHNPFHGCVGALDGLAIQIERPKTPNSQSHYNRKGFFAVNMQALCDAEYQFTFASCRCAGSTHDSLAFSTSDLFEIVQDRTKFLRPYWIAADDAYPASDAVLTPWSGRSLEVYKDSFNFHLSSLRIHIEQSFGIFVSRWGILWRPLKVHYDRVGPLIMCLVRMHNFCLKDPITPYRHKDQYGTVHVIPPIVVQDKCDTDDGMHKRRRDLESCPLREAFTAYLREQKIVRPVRT